VVDGSLQWPLPTAIQSVTLRQYTRTGPSPRDRPTMTYWDYHSMDRLFRRPGLSDDDAGNSWIPTDYFERSVMQPRNAVVCVNVQRADDEEDVFQSQGVVNNGERRGCIGPSIHSIFFYHHNSSKTDVQQYSCTDGSTINGIPMVPRTILPYWCLLKSTEYAAHRPQR